MSSSEPPDDPEPSDVADVFPEGISMGTSSGLAVLRVAFDGDDERAKIDAEDMSKKHAETADPSPTTTTLFHPTTGVPVTIIGTAHVSALAARQTRELILRLKPDVVVLELDPQRLVSMLRDAQLKLPARHLAETNVHTHWDALSVMYQGRLVQVMGGLAYAAVGAVLGSNPGAEFLAAVDAAKEVGAQIVVGDLDAKTTTARLFARTKWRQALRKAMGKVRKDENDQGSNDEGIARQSGSDDDGESSHRHKHGPNLATGKRPPAKPVLVVWPDGSERPVPVAPPKELRRLISLAQCDAASTERGAWHLALHADPDPNDLLAVRVCAEKVVELLRSDAFLEKHGRFSGDPSDESLDDDDDDDSSQHGPSLSSVKLPLSTSSSERSSKSNNNPSYDSGWAMDATLRLDRDLVLAHSLHRHPGGVKKVVGVVGAAHVAGIKQEWPNVSSDFSKRKFQETLSPTPEECTLQGARAKFGQDKFGWWDQPGYFETGVGAFGLAGLVGLALVGGKGGGGTTDSHLAVTNEKTVGAAARSVSSRLNRFAMLGAAVVAGACLTGAFATTHVMVELGRFATKLERAGLAAEAAGIVPPKKNELRSAKWNGPDAVGALTRNIRVDAVNVVVPYPEGEEW